MTSSEVEFNIKVPSLLNEIAKQLKIANKLRAVELKSKAPADLDVIDMVDSIMRNA